MPWGELLVLGFVSVAWPCTHWVNMTVINPLQPVSSSVKWGKPPHDTASGRMVGHHKVTGVQTGVQSPGRGEALPGLCSTELAGA